MLLRVISFMLVLIFFATNAWGEILSFEARTTYLLPHDEDVNEEVKIKGGLGFGAAVMYGWRDRGVELSVERVGVEIKNDTLDGDLVMFPIIFSGYLRFHPVGRRWFPFVGLGVGMVANSFNPDKNSDKDIAMSDALAFQASAGIEIFLIRKLSVSFQARYLFARANVQIEESNGDSTDDRFKMDTAGVSFGIKKYL